MFPFNLKRYTILKEVTADGSVTFSVSMFISKMSDRYGDFGLKPTMGMGFVLTTLALFLIGSTTPAWSTVRPNADEALLFQPR